MTEQTGILPAGFVYGEQAQGIPSPIPQLQSPHSVLISRENFTCNTLYRGQTRLSGLFPGLSDFPNKFHSPITSFCLEGNAFLATQIPPFHLTGHLLSPAFKMEKAGTLILN